MALNIAVAFVAASVCTWVLNKCLDKLYKWAKPKIVARLKHPKRYQIMFI